MPILSLVNRARLRGVRYVPLVVAALAGLLWGRHDNQPGITDWLTFEYAARVLLHWPKYSSMGGPPLHLYAHNPWIQIGPPAVLAVAAVQWLPWREAQLLLDAVMSGMGIGDCPGLS